MLTYLKDHFPYFGAHILRLRDDISELKDQISYSKFISDTEIALLKNKLHEKDKENEFLLLQLYQVQQEIDKPSDSELAAQNKVIDLQKKLEELQIKFLESENKLAKYNREISDSKNTIAQLKNANLLAIAEQDKQKIELENALSNLEQQEVHSKKLMALELEYASLKNNFEIRLKQNETYNKSEIDNMRIENERLMLSLHRAQEELENIYLESKRNKEELDNYVRKWRRLETQFPTYFDVGSIKVKTNQLTAEENIEFNVIDYHKGLVDLKILTFLLQDADGHLGFKITEGIYFYPSLAVSQQSELAKYVKLKHDSAKYIEAAITVVEFAIRSKWRGIELDSVFDPAFWTIPLTNMVSAYRKLPLLFRYDYAKLKMEVNNSDYENIWLELNEVSYGNRYLPKIEVRVSGAMIKRGEFSRYPKIEIPLIDGIEKPFSSWYPESSDAYGQKLEFRFDLNRKVMDTQVWSKLSAPDASFCLGLVGALPRVIDELKNDKILISRSWDEWLTLLFNSIQIINDSRKSETSDSNEVKIKGPISELNIKDQTTKRDFIGDPARALAESRSTKKITITKTKKKQP